VSNSQLPIPNSQTTRFGSCLFLPTSRPTPSRWSRGACSAWGRAKPISGFMSSCAASSRCSAPWRCSGSLPDGPGAAARRGRGRGGHRGCLAGGGASTLGRQRSGWAGSPPFAHDGTERRIVRPQAPPAQAQCYSGKKKDHTVKNVLLVNALLLIGIVKLTQKIARPCSKERTIEDFGLARAPVFSLFLPPQLSSRGGRLGAIFH
jgi:hypothetical protein